MKRITLEDLKAVAEASASGKPLGKIISRASEDPSAASFNSLRNREQARLLQYQRTRAAAPAASLAEVGRAS